MTPKHKTKPLRKYYVWLHDDSVTVTTQDTPPAFSDGGLFEEKNVLSHVIEAATWEEAMAIHHIRMGWSPYKPQGLEQECPKCSCMFFPMGSGECWSCGHKQ